MLNLISTSSNDIKWISHYSLNNELFFRTWTEKSIITIMYHNEKSIPYHNVRLSDFGPIFILVSIISGITNILLMKRKWVFKIKLGNAILLLLLVIIIYCIYCMIVYYCLISKLFIYNMYQALSFSNKYIFHSLLCIIILTFYEFVIFQLYHILCHSCLLFISRKWRRDSHLTSSTNRMYFNIIHVCHN